MTGFKTCATCIGYINCPTYTRHYKNTQQLLPPEITTVKIHTAAQFIAEACPEYFKVPG